MKNAGKEPQRKTWGHLIKTYNSQVHGNVEHFSICSDDSIWEEETEETKSSGEYRASKTDPFSSNKLNHELNPVDHSYTIKRDSPKILNNNNNSESQNNHQCFFVSSTTENDAEQNPFSLHKYKNQIMEKYLRDCREPTSDTLMEDVSKPSMISKWLESAVNFRPSENNYLNWTLSKVNNKNKRGIKKKMGMNGVYTHQHGREELDAAEALTTLASVHAELNQWLWELLFGVNCLVYYCK